MLLIVGTIRLPPQNLRTARAAMERMILASRAEDGCLEYSYSEDILELGLIRVQELWRDQQALDQHWASAQIAEWRAQWLALGLTDRNLQCYRVCAPTQV